MPQDADGGAPSEERPGQRIRQYEIIEEIGRGGMGILYRGRDHNLERPVALKRPLPRIVEDPEQRRRFLREGRAASRISHSSVVPVYDTFEEAGIPWLIMEFIPGSSLRALLEREGRLAPQTVLAFGEQLASALKCAHERNVLHRDINPRNILVRGDDQVLLTDFGLARFLGSDSDSSTASTRSDSVTGEGVVVGTLQYMSPEQAVGKPLDARSDIYALGAVLYEMCTGRPAFAKSQLGELMDAILHHEPEPIPRFTYEIPDDLERIIRKCLSKSPGERYQDAANLLVDLRTVRRRLEFAAYSRSHSTSEVAGSRPLRRVVPVAAALGLAGLVWWLGHLSFGTPLPHGRPVQVTITTAWEGEPALSPDGSRIAYTSDAAGNMDIYVIDVHGGNPLRLTDAPTDQSDPAWFPDGSALVYVSDVDDQPAIWRSGPFGGDATVLIQNASHPAVSPDGRQLAFERDGPSGLRSIWVAPLSDPLKASALTSDRDGRWYHWGPAWSPDGREICYCTRENLWIVPASGGPAHRLTSGGDLDTDPVWSPHGPFVYFASDRGGNLAIWRASTRRGEPLRVTLGTGPETQPSVSRDGARLAYSTQKSTYDTIIRNRRTGREAVVTGRRSDWMPTLAPDARAVVFVSDRGGPHLDLWIQNLALGEPVGEPRRLTNQPGDASHPAFSPDGRWVAYYLIENQQRDIWMMSAAGGEPVRLTHDPAGNIQPAWSPDGRRLAFTTDEGGRSIICIAPLLAGGRLGNHVRVTGPDLGATMPAWSPDGAQLAFIGRKDGSTDVWIMSAEGGDVRRVSSGVNPNRIGWDRSTGDLLISGVGNGRPCSLWRWNLKTATAVPELPEVSFGKCYPYPFFDISQDAELLVYSRERLTGDLWILESLDRPY